MNLKLSFSGKLSRGVWVWLGVALVALGVAVWLYGQTRSNPPKPWVVKWQISRYLKSQTGRSDFSVPFAFPSKAEMNKAPAVVKTRTGTGGGAELTKKDFDTIKKEYADLLTSAMALRREATDLQKAVAQKRAQLAALEKQLAEAQASSATNLADLQADVAPVRAQVDALEKALAGKEVAAAEKEKAVEPVLAELQAFQKNWSAQRETTDPADTNTLAYAQAKLAKDMRQKLQEAGSYEAMYRLIGQELWVADRLFDSANPDHRRVALSLARQAGRDALYEAENGWLAANIYKGYVWPNRDLLSGRAGDNLLGECTDMLRRAGDHTSELGLLQTLLAQAATPQRADWARVQLSQSHEQANEYKEAIDWLKQVKATNDFRWALQRIPWLERRMGRPR